MKKLFASVCIAAILSTGGAMAEPRGTFRQAHELGFGANSDLDPASRGRVFQITEKIYSRLVRPGEDGRPSADLATAWSSNDDATVWTLTLRDGVTFHDGSTFDADDVVYTLNRILDPATDSPVRSAIRMITSVEAVSPTEVRLSLDTPFADLPLQLMDYRLRIIPEGSGDTIAQTGIGTGPFRLVSFDAHGITRLEANMDYFLGPPGVAHMEIIGIADAQARLQALLGGQIDTERVTAQQLPMLRANPRLRVDEVPTGNWRGIVFRTDVAPFNDPRVRMALRLAADREELVQLVLGGFGVVSCDNPVSPNDQYRAEMSCPQDIPRARALLAEAGFADGIDVDVYVSTIESTWPAMVEAYQAQAAEAELHDQQHAERAVGRLRASDHREGDPDQQAADEAVHETRGDQHLGGCQKDRPEIDDDQRQQDHHRGRPPRGAPDDEHRSQGADRRAIDVGGGDEPGLPGRQAGAAGQAVDQGGHDVDVEQAGGRQEGQQHAGQQAVLGRAGPSAADRRQGGVGHRQIRFILAASTAAGAQSNTPLSPK